MKDFGHKKVIDREDKYHQRRLNRGALSPERADPFAKPNLPSSQGPYKPGATASNVGVGVKRTYYDIMTEQNLANEKAEIIRKIEKQEDEKKRTQSSVDSQQATQQKRQRFDDTTSTANVTVKSHLNQPSEWDKHEVGDIK